MNPSQPGFLNRARASAIHWALRLGWAGSSVEAHSGMRMPLMALPWANSRIGFSSDSSEFQGLLGEGVSSSTRIDPQAKGLGEWLRARVVELPVELLERQGG